jgi:hypothetical protein
MKKKMERLDDPLFRPLTDAEQGHAQGAFTTYTAVTIRETATSTGSDFVRDGDNE